MTFCPHLLSINLCGGNCDDPDYIERLSIPCSLEKGHDGGHRFPIPERKVSQ